MSKYSTIVDEVMRRIGFTETGGNGIYVRPNNVGGETIFIGGSMEEFLDAFYARAHSDGWERGAYEEQQQEDRDDAATRRGT